MFPTQPDQLHFTEGTEPSPQRPQSGQGAWLRDLGSDLGALCECDHETNNHNSESLFDRN